MRLCSRLAALLLALAAAAGCTRAPEPAREASPASVQPAPPASDPGTTATATSPKPLRSPKPGERVRQPELDGYCEGDDAVAFYYHGGNPTTRVARNDRCTPLFFSECESEGRCYPPRDQEPGMWCCAPRPDEAPPAAHAAR